MWVDSNEKATTELQEGDLDQADLRYDNSAQTKHIGRREKTQVLSSVRVKFCRLDNTQCYTWNKHRIITSGLRLH